MADPRFFTNQGPFKLADLARAADAELGPNADPERLVRDVAPLDAAGPDELSFLDNTKYVEIFRASKAGACVVAAKFAGDAPAGMAILLSERPYRSYAQIARTFYPRRSADASARHPSAVIDPAATVGEGCEIGAHAVVSAGAAIGAGVTIGAGAVIGDAVTVGAETEIGANSSLSHCDVGARCLLHPGVRIGQRGFGFDMSPEGHLDVPQLGRVIVGDDVEIGANTTIDRGAIEDTIVGDGAKLDNQIQIAHNVVIGAHTVMAALTGVSGSTEIGSRCLIGGGCLIAGHLSICDDVTLAAGTGVASSVDKPGAYGGYPANADEISRWRRNVVRYSQLDEMARRLRKLERRFKSFAGDE